MKKIALIFLTGIFIWISGAKSQTTDNEKTIKKIKHVFELAKSGYEKENAGKLVRASKIMIANPQIQNMKSNGEKKTLEYDFFDVRKLLEDAGKYVSPKAKRMQRKITELEDSLPKYVQMSIKKGGVSTKKFSVEPNQTKIIDAEFLKDEKVNISVFLGQYFNLSIIDTANNQNVGFGKHIGEDCLVIFTSQSTSTHQIKIENRVSQSVDGAIIIEKK